MTSDSISRLLDAKTDILLQWIHPSSCILVEEVQEEGGRLIWEYNDVPYEVTVQNGPFRFGNDLVFFVRGNEPHTFNPFLQANFDPEFMGKFEGLARQYYSDKGIVVDEAFVQKQSGYWISNALYGSLGKDESDRDFFNAIRESKFMIILKMAAGVAIWEMVQQLVVLIGENF